jgi:hypothetical protein
MSGQNKSEALKEEFEQLLAKARVLRSESDELEAEITRVKGLLGLESRKPESGEWPARGKTRAGAGGS